MGLYEKYKELQLNTSYKVPQSGILKLSDNVLDSDCLNSRLNAGLGYCKKRIKFRSQLLIYENLSNGTYEIHDVGDFPILQNRGLDSSNRCIHYVKYSKDFLGYKIEGTCYLDDELRSFIKCHVPSYIFYRSLKQYEEMQRIVRSWRSAAIV